MGNKEILAKLIDIKSQIAELGIKHIENSMPIHFSDIAATTRPFTRIDTAINLAIKNLTPTESGLIPKSSTLKT